MAIYALIKGLDFREIRQHICSEWFLRYVYDKQKIFIQPVSSQNPTFKTAEEVQCLNKVQCTQYLIIQCTLC